MAAQRHALSCIRILQDQVQKLRDEREGVAREVAVLRVDLDATRADR